LAQKANSTYTRTDEANVIKIRYTCFHKTACREIAWQVGKVGKVRKGVRPRFDHVFYGLGVWLKMGEIGGWRVAYIINIIVIVAGNSIWQKF